MFFHSRLFNVAQPTPTDEQRDISTQTQFQGNTNINTIYKDEMNEKICKTFKINLRNEPIGTRLQKKKKICSIRLGEK